jgi:hypothetical protein
MKKFIKDEMNIKDIINSVDLNKVLYTTDATALDIGVPLGNVIVVEYDESTVLDLAELNGLNYFDNEYVVLSITEVIDNKRYIYLKEIPMIQAT